VGKIHLCFGLKKLPKWDEVVVEKVLVALSISTVAIPEYVLFHASQEICHFLLDRRICSFPIGQDIVAAIRQTVISRFSWNGHGNADVTRRSHTLMYRNQEISGKESGQVRSNKILMTNAPPPLAQISVCVRRNVMPGLSNTSFLSLHTMDMTQF
jgi:hypothetical protein